MIAVAVENAEKTNPGMVVFFNRHFKLLGAVQVGALPDMLTFSPDGPAGYWSLTKASPVTTIRSTLQARLASLTCAGGRLA